MSDSQPKFRSPVLLAFAALGVYAALAALLIWHGASLTAQISGAGSDPFDSIWFLSWWPYALTHQLDPFFTRIIWYPIGVPLLWVTSVPLLALLAWPVTASGGAVLSYNLLILTAPPLAAWCAYLLCRHLARDFAAALIGGFLFGFSTYETAQSIGALNLAVIFCVPLLLLVVLKRLDDELSRRQAVALAALLLLAQFLICIEIFAMVFVFGGIAWALALGYLRPRRAALWRLLADGLWTAPFVLIPLAPLLLSMARHYALISHPAAWPYVFTADLASLVIPSPLNLFGAPFKGLIGGYAADPQETCAYLGLPLLVILYLFARSPGARAMRRYGTLMFLICLVCSLGPFLWVGGHFTGIAMPWLVFVHLPLLGSALPVRFALFTALTAALMAASWLAVPGRRAWRLALGLLACIALLPQPHPWRAVSRPAFFRPGAAQRLLGPNPRLIVLPFAIHGPSSMWQAQSRFGFTEVGGYLGFPPAPAQHFKAVMQLFAGSAGPGLNPGDFAAYARASGAQYVAAGPGTDPAVFGAIAQLGWKERETGGVTLITVPAAP